MNREKTMQEIVVAIATLEKSSDQEIESVKKFLRWLPDRELQDIRDKHNEALKNMIHTLKKS